MFDRHSTKMFAMTMRSQTNATDECRVIIIMESNTGFLQLHKLLLEKGSQDQVGSDSTTCKCNAATQYVHQTVSASFWTLH